MVVVPHNHSAVEAYCAWVCCRARYTRPEGSIHSKVRCKKRVQLYIP